MTSKIISPPGVPHLPFISRAAEKLHPVTANEVMEVRGSARLKWRLRSPDAASRERERERERERDAVVSEHRKAAASCHYLRESERSIIRCAPRSQRHTDPGCRTI
jgi:hypothetical protein